MSETFRQHNPNELSEIYAKLNSHDVEQFYAGYQWWNLQQRSVTLQEQIEDLYREIAANAELMEMVHPPAIALATMARLQASSVKDLDLLDRMLERGEDWLDRTMQRLDYCEQLDFILDDYTRWCQNALEGAYDWIDSMREGETASSTEVPTGDTSTKATEELLLQKLTSEEGEQSPSSETIPEFSAFSLEEPAPIIEESLTTVPEELVSTPEEHATISEEAQGTVETASSLEETRTVSQVSQVSQLVEINAASNSPVEGDDGSDFMQFSLQEHTEDILADESPIDWEESLPYRMYPPDKQPGIEADGIENAEQSGMQDVMPERRRNFLQRLWRR